jgi:aryl-alcohol dehydrogenase-like predicted oxidoreductase
MGAKLPPDHLKQALDGSLKRLRLDRIDLYQLHTVDSKVPIEESVGALKQMQDAGKIRHIGLSNVDRKEIDRARKIVPIVSVQNRYNIEDRSSEDVLVYCEKEKLGFLPWFPVGGGRGLKAENPVNAAAKAHGVSVYQVALAWLLERSPGNAADSRHVISGALGRKRRRRKTEVNSRRMESD